MKKIAILTSGGDAPGMNACLRACVRYAIYNNLEVYGVERGYLGLINDDIFPMNTRSVSGIVQRGGTILKSARSQEFCTEEGIKKAAANLHVHGITTLIVIGGDGTFKGGKALSDNYDVNVIGIPGTIDNDLQYTDFTIGFDTAVNTCLWAINSLRDTMDSHDRASLVEVMGRHCGDIALHAGICGGAEYILTPEVPFDLDEIAKGLKRGGSRGKTSNMIVFAEGAGNRDEIVKYLSEKSGVKITTTRIGHIQRGGSPTAFDRMLAVRLATRAIDCILQGKRNSVVGIHNNQIIDMPIKDALELPRSFDKRLYEIARVLAL
ncbi:MAG: 6-phosphofructokinase [Clostridia bacterium]|nr:6-phosphofructokinase [Clostridia bacterium]MBQ3495310.1 6-phosphofructokinase [Clostridia bacterium]MBR2933232.1 6-phosphofructokinase [Clostridia bacterium]